MLRRKYKVFLFVSVLVLAAGALTFLFFNDPLESRWLPPCLFYKLTGIYCPGCGSTRATYHLIHGNILMSLRNNVLMLPTFVCAAVLFFKEEWTHKVAVSRTVCITVILYMILRNLPHYPFTLLAPVF